MKNSTSNSESETTSASGGITGEIPQDIQSAASAIMDRVVGDLGVGLIDCYTLTEGMESLALQSYALMCADWDTPWHGTVWVQATSMRHDLVVGQGKDLVLNGQLGGSCACLEKLSELSLLTTLNESANAEVGAENDALAA